MRVFVAAHCNINNGDRAVLEATINTIKREIPDSEIIVSAAEPFLIHDSRFRVVGWPRKKDFLCRLVCRLIVSTKRFDTYKYWYKYITDKHYLKEVRKADIVFISGGHHLTDILGELNYFNLATNFLVPIYEKKRIYLLPQSVGPADAFSIRENIKYILENVNGIAFRDKSSETFLNDLKLKNKYRYVPDMVFSMEYDNAIDKMPNKTIGVALYCSYYGIKRKLLMPKVINNLVLTLEHYINSGYKVRIISMDLNDEVVAGEIISKLNIQDEEVIQIEKPKDNNILSVIELFRDKDIVLAYKTHSVVFSLINLVPVVAIAYHPKSIEFMENIGLLDYAVLDEMADYDTLCKLIERGIRNKTEINELERNGCDKNRKMIEKYFIDINEELK